MVPAKLPSHWSKGQPSSCAAQALGTDLRLSGLAASDFMHRAVFPAPEVFSPFWATISSRIK